MVKIIVNHTFTSEILVISFLLEMKKTHVLNITVNEFCSQFNILVSLFSLVFLSIISSAVTSLPFAISFCA